MRAAAALGVVVCAGGTAFGQYFSNVGPTGHTRPGETRLNEYTIDDGVAEDAIGLTAGGAMTWANRFTSVAGQETITGINVAFGVDSVINGLALTANVWSDPNGDGSPVDGVILSSVAGVISGAVDATPGNVFVTFDIPDVMIPAGQNFFLGIILPSHSAGMFPAAIDQTATQVRSWVGIGEGWGGTVGEIGTFGLPGNWQVRGNAVPAPSGLALLAVGGLAAFRRRR